MDQPAGQLLYLFMLPSNSPTCREKENPTLVCGFGMALKSDPFIFQMEFSSLVEKICLLPRRPVGGDPR